MFSRVQEHPRMMKSRLWVKQGLSTITLHRRLWNVMVDSPCFTHNLDFIILGCSWTLENISCCLTLFRGFLILLRVFSTLDLFLRHLRLIFGVLPQGSLQADDQLL